MNLTFSSVHLLQTEICNLTDCVSYSYNIWKYIYLEFKICINVCSKFQWPPFFFFFYFLCSLIAFWCYTHCPHCITMMSFWKWKSSTQKHHRIWIFIRCSVFIGQECASWKLERFVAFVYSDRWQFKYRANCRKTLQLMQTAYGSNKINIHETTNFFGFFFISLSFFEFA